MAPAPAKILLAAAWLSAAAAQYEQTQSFQGDLICGVATPSRNSAVPGYSLIGTNVGGTVGPEHLYRLTLAAETEVELVSSAWFNEVLNVFDFGVTTRLATAASAVFSGAHVTTTLPAGTYMVVIEGVGANDRGPYTIRSTCTPTGGTSVTPPPTTPPPTTPPPTTRPPTTRPPTTRPPTTRPPTPPPTSPPTPPPTLPPTTRPPTTRRHTHTHPPTTPTPTSTSAPASFEPTSSPTPAPSRGGDGVGVIPTPSSDYCPEGYIDDGARYNWGIGKITVTTSHEECSDRCTLYSSPEFAGGCKSYMTGMYFGMLFCRAYGGSLRTTGCASWANPANPGVGSGALGAVNPVTNQVNIGGNCCSNSTFVDR